MLSIDRDRRQDERVSLTRSCKVYEPRARRYIPGTTRNASRHGMLLRLDRPVDLAAGDRLFVAVAPRRQAVLRSREMIAATVVRTLPITCGETAVAVRFAAPAPAVLLPLTRAA